MFFAPSVDSSKRENLSAEVAGRCERRQTLNITFFLCLTNEINTVYGPRIRMSVQKRCSKNEHH